MRHMEVVISPAMPILPNHARRNVVSLLHSLPQRRNSTSMSHTAPHPSAEKVLSCPVTGDGIAPCCTVTFGGGRGSVGSSASRAGGGDKL